MAHIKLFMDDEIDLDFELYAIHSVAPDYKLAFLMNQHLDLRLTKERDDLDLSERGVQADFPLFVFDDRKKYRKFYLVGNKGSSKLPVLTSCGGLFRDQTQESRKNQYVVPELKRADYLIKLDCEPGCNHGLAERINRIPHIMTCYQVDIDQLKSIKNLLKLE